ncbi:hypothetical protein E1176_07350 [Fulvivirga sp. RKSG066]|uniref:sulfotransferase family protein n=1 Tax=Fulvivirga aurantia TaxID=2529383 RepID=UPI0012BBEE88|nr:sulfotransferase [Fulvivirga aurantia]MTI20831.1 hypothetical protein [Fulvivirga aurantia]
MTKLLPDFLIIGAGKSGTTSLDNYLKQHEAIYMSPVKEPNFFAYDKIDIQSLDKDALQHYKESVTDLETYKSLFNDSKPNQLLGETSNTYLVIDGTAEVIKDYIPNTKIIAIIRQPTKRLYSRYLHLARENELPSQDFSEVLDKSSIWWVRNDLVKEGFYYKNLKRYFDVFPKENIKVLLHEDLKRNSKSVLSEVFEFLGVGDIETIDDSIEYNKSGFIKNKFYDRTFGHNSIFKKAAKALIPNRLYTKVKSVNWLQKMVNDLQNSNLKRPELDHNLYRKITEEVYLDDIKNLEKLINRDLSSWK